MEDRMKKTELMKSTIIIGLIVILLFSGISAGMASNGGTQKAETLPGNQEDYSTAANPESIIMNLNLQLPQGSRIDYLRIFYYDKSPAIDSSAWITIYDGLGSISDLTTINSSGSAGFGTTLSPYVGHIVDNLTYSYVLNWRPEQLGSNMQLCGFRVAYRLPDGLGGWGSFYYIFDAGTTLKPRDSDQLWGYGGTGCTYAKIQSYLPMTLKK
jgi:hypothetical protein